MTKTSIVAAAMLGLITACDRGMPAGGPRATETMILAATSAETTEPTPSSCPRFSSTDPNCTAPPPPGGEGIPCLDPRLPCPGGGEWTPGGGGGPGGGVPDAGAPPVCPVDDELASALLVKVMLGRGIVTCRNYPVGPLGVPEEFWLSLDHDFFRAAVAPDARSGNCKRCFVRAAEEFSLRVPGAPPAPGVAQMLGILRPKCIETLVELSANPAEMAAASLLADRYRDALGRCKRDTCDTSPPAPHRAYCACQPDYLVGFPGPRPGTSACVP